jgi:hypothetical protein
MATPSYDEARRMLKASEHYPFGQTAANRLQTVATLAVAEALQEVAGLLKAIDARHRREAAEDPE